MIPPTLYASNLSLVRAYAHVRGAVVECGTWRGGMIAGIATILGLDRDYYLLDSFEGLPAAKDIDGDAARSWQRDVESPYHFDNCRAEVAAVERAMQMAGVQNAHIVKGWFHDTLLTLPADLRIAILRLDGDWYDSTMVCLTSLYDRVTEGGLIIVDDYYAWTGCARAVHDFLSKNALACRIAQWRGQVAYFVKRSAT
jgi:hypothetical protein